MDKVAASTYLQRHGVRPAWGNGRVIARVADDLVDPGEVEQPPVVDDARQHLDWARGNLDAAQTQFQKAYAATSVTKARPLIAAGIKALGDVGVELTEVGQRLDPAPPEEPGGGGEEEPPSTGAISAVYLTYLGHGLAKDGYPGRTAREVQWGPHHGVPIRAPAAGRVEVYSNATPLGTLRALSAEYQANHHDLFDRWTCWETSAYQAWAMGGAVSPQQTMYIAVFWPDGPLVIRATTVGHLHYGHVAQAIKAGKVAAGDVFATVWDTGVRWEPRIDARAAHVHACAGAGRQLSPNGDLDGLLALVAQGWTPLTDVGSAGPGPTDYESGRYCAGRLRSDFAQAGIALPAVPS